MPPSTHATRLTESPTATPPEMGDRNGAFPPAGGAMRGATRYLVLRLAKALRRYPLLCATVLLLACSVGLWLLGYHALANWTLAVLTFVGCLPLAWETLVQLWHREFGVDLLALLAIGGSLILQQYLAGAVIVLMLSGGEALEAFALRRAKRSLTGLAERAPRIAHVQQGDEVHTVPADAVEVGVEVIVKQGELIPVDGVVTAGTSSVSEADLTGEPLPVHKAQGGLVLSGSVNLDAPLWIRATTRSADSQYAQIVRLVREAQERKAPIHRLADRYAVWFTALALTIASIAWILSHDSLYALAVLVVATPCPLILATPIAIMSGIDHAARQGLIVKSGATIEGLGEVDVAVFDKTGTLTLGTPCLTRVELLYPAPPPDGESVHTEMDKPPLTEERALSLVASVEQFSPHILARAVVEAAHEGGAHVSLGADVEETPGKGVRGWAPFPPGLESLPKHPASAAGDSASSREGWIEVAIGNRTFMQRLAITLPETLVARRAAYAETGEIASFLALNGSVVGLLVFADAPRSELASLAPALKKSGIRATVLLTGDGEAAAQRIGGLAGMDRVVAHCLPPDKARIVGEWERHGHHVLMVGDGVNDAPALAAATVGVAMGAQGLTVAASAADAVLLAPDVSRVAEAVRLGRQVMHIARQGIWVGISLSIVAMLVAARGYLPPTAGAFLQEGIDVVVILNALRAGRG